MLGLLKDRLDLLHSQVCLTQDGPQDTRCNIVDMYGHCDQQIPTLELQVASFLAHFVESQFLQCSHQTLGSCDR